MRILSCPLPRKRKRKRTRTEFDSETESVGSNSQMSSVGATYKEPKSWDKHHNSILRKVVKDSYRTSSSSTPPDKAFWESVVFDVKYLTGVRYRIWHVNEGIQSAQLEDPDFYQLMQSMGGFQSDVVAKFASEERKLYRDNNKKFKAMLSTSGGVKKKKSSSGQQNIYPIGESHTQLIDDTHPTCSHGTADLVWSINQCIKDVEANFGELSIRDFVAATAYFKDFNIREVYMSASLPRREGLVLQFKSIPT